MSDFRFKIKCHECGEMACISESFGTTFLFGCACGVQLTVVVEDDRRLSRPPSKPSWDDAPEWAEWMLQTPKGAWVFHDEKPILESFRWSMRLGERSKYAGHSLDSSGWRDSLERRPLPPCECGGEAVVGKNIGGVWGVSCTECGMIIVGSHTEDASRRAWRKLMSK